jgi:hypothetical protein
MDRQTDVGKGYLQQVAVYVHSELPVDHFILDEITSDILCGVTDGKG